MYISYNWLQDFVKLSSKINYQTVAEKLTAHTVEIESAQNQAEAFKNVVVGKVLEVKKHPNADKLRIAKIDIKNKELNIVCGAPNIEADQLVPVALEGAILPGDFEIKTSEIRGEVSEGMVCAEDELGLGIEHDGIMVLSKKAKIGEPFATYLKTNDIIFEVDNKSLSNRPDLLSHYGLARELSVLFKTPIRKYDEVIGEKLIFDEKKDKVPVEISDKNKCLRYTTIKIDNIRVEPSPDWLKERLVAIKQRPVNNIVDLANYVMFDCGQPLHTFDAAKVKKILVRNANNHEVIETLDGKERKLGSEDLVITDGKTPIAVAGIIGGSNSEVGENSTAIILEAANFSASSIRKTGQRLGIRSEASLRFEKSLDPNLTEVALRRYLSLLLELFPEAVISNALTDIYPVKPEVKKININLKWLNKKIGQEIPESEVLDTLSRLEFVVDKKDEDLEITVPSWRATKDVNQKEDIVEEVLRIHGYDNIKSSLPVEELLLPKENMERDLERKIKDLLAYRYSLTEVHNYSFVGEEQLKKLNIDYFHHLKLANPLSELSSMLRQSLAPNFFQNIKNNQSKSDNLSLFEIGNTFFDAPGGYEHGDQEGKVLPYQEKRLGIVLASKNKKIFNDLKDLIVNLLKDILGNDKDVSFSHLESSPSWSDNKMAARVSVLGQDVAWLGLVNKDVVKNLNLKLETVILEMNFDKLLSIYKGLPPFRINETAKFPPVTRDLSFVFSEKILYNDVKEVLSSFNPLIREVQLFDVYQGDKLGEGEKSLAFHLVYQASDRTLTSAEVDKIQNELVQEVSDRFGAKLRNF